MRVLNGALIAIFWELVLIHLKGVKAVKILSVTIPVVVENGTIDSVILDCQYSYTERDNLLVVKWFLNKDPEPIYQWITEYNTRHVSERLRDHINSNYVATPSNNMTRYRALNIIRPTTEHSGTYSCHVVSLTSQDSREVELIVYAQPKRFEVNYTKTADGANLTCEVEDIYPLPQMVLLRRTLQDAHFQQMHDVSYHIHKGIGSYHLHLVHSIQDRTFQIPGAPVFYECGLFLDVRDKHIMRREKSLIYYPGSPASHSASGIEGQRLLTSVALILLMEAPRQID